MLPDGFPFHQFKPASPPDSLASVIDDILVCRYTWVIFCSDIGVDARGKLSFAGVHVSVCGTDIVARSSGSSIPDIAVKQEQ